MLNSLNIIAEAVLRVEHKVDVLLQIRLYDWKSAYPMGQGTMCPVCLSEIKYQMNLSANVVTRKCGCGTKLSPMLFDDTDASTNNPINNPVITNGNT